MTVLDWERVEEIRERWEGGETQASLCVEFQVSLNTIAKIVKGQSWVRKGMVQRTAGRGRVEDPDAILERAMALQAQVNERRGIVPPLSLLDGGDAPDETGGGGLAKLMNVTKEMRDEGTL